MIKVVSIDDSAVVRRSLERMLSRDPEIQVVGTAPDPFAGRDLIVRTSPDVVLLDLEMPRMDGMTFLRKLMQARPTPVLIVSSLTRNNSKLVLEALRAGAVDVVSKPRGAHTLDEVARELIEKIKSAKNARVFAKPRSKAAGPPPNLGSFENSHQVLAIGASTGGTRALEVVLEGMHPRSPGCLVVQHMPQEFTRSFAERLDGLTSMRVKEAEPGDLVTAGLMLIAPGNRHMELQRSGALYRVVVKDGERVSRHRPSVDVLFHSVAKHAGKNAVAAILTGMGDDGAAGMLALRRAGAYTIAQDEATSVVYGMPKAALDMGGVQVVAPLEQIANAMMKQVSISQAKVS